MTALIYIVKVFGQKEMPDPLKSIGALNKRMKDLPPAYSGDRNTGTIGTLPGMESPAGKGPGDKKATTGAAASSAASPGNSPSNDGTGSGSATKPTDAHTLSLAQKLSCFRPLVALGHGDLNAMNVLIDAMDAVLHLLN